MKLVLFDIDGTILKSQGIGRAAIAETIEHVLGRRLPVERVSFAGRTDPEIMRDLLTMGEYADQDIEDALARCLNAYVTVLMRRLTPSTVNLLPGVRDLVTHLHGRADIALGVLTGNLKETAYLKLHAAGLGSKFPFGAFGSDSHDRNHLPDVAVERAYQLCGLRFEPASVYVIGDTPNDIACARAYGATSIGVCTGTFTRDELLPCAPDLLLDDLLDAGPILRLLDDVPERDVRMA